MSLKSGFAFLGSLVGVGGAVALFYLLGLGWIALAVLAAVVLVLYIGAAIAASSTTRTTVAGEVLRGALIGLNSGVNALLIQWIVAILGGAGTLSWSLGLSLAGLSYLSVFAPISRNGFYQGLIGWLTWVLPMSWLIVALGIGFMLVSIILSLLTVFAVPYLRIQSMKLDANTGTVFVKGGLVANLNYLKTAFNMGNLSFVDRASGSWYLDHEAGHTLNLSVFGSIFHLIGAVDENIIPGRGRKAYAERIADSNVVGSASTNIPMWS